MRHQQVLSVLCAAVLLAAAPSGAGASTAQPVEGMGATGASGATAIDSSAGSFELSTVHPDPGATSGLATVGGPTVSVRWAADSPSEPATIASGAAAATAKPPMALGVFIPGVPQYMSRLDQFATTTGAMPHIVEFFQAWGAAWNYFDATAMDAITSRGAVPMVAWEPWAGTTNDTRWALRTIISGAHDAYIDAWAAAAAAWAKPVYIRFAYEMNGNWEPWSRWHNGNTPAQFIKAWRHVVTRFRLAGATNVRWVWSPNEPDIGTTTPLSQDYPGAAYVDWVGFSAYNWGTAVPAWGHQWRSMVNAFKTSVHALTILAPGKPMVVTETGSVEQGGSKAVWIQKGYAALITTYPAIRAIIYFDYKDSRADWRLNSSASSLAAYSNVAVTPAYSGTLP